MNTVSQPRRYAHLTILTILLAVGLLTACKREAPVAPSSSGGSTQVDDNGGHGNDDPPGDDNGGGN